MHAAEHIQLQTNPFTANASGARIGRPLQAALGEVIRQIGHEAPVVVVCGSAGAGKTLLMNMIARSCTEMGLCARQIDRGDLMHVAFGQCADVLLIDEADSIAESTLHTLISAGSNTSTTTMIFLCLPSNVRRFTSSGGRAVIIELAPLTHSDARNYLLERATSAGRPDLFDADALDLLIDGSRGSPRVLRSIASLSFFAAAVDSSPRIARRHVADALASQIHCETPKFDHAAIPAPRRAEIPTPIPTPVTAAPATVAPIAAAPIIAPPIPKPITAAPVTAAPIAAPPVTAPAVTPARVKIPTPVLAFAPGLAEPAPAKPASDPEISEPPPGIPSIAEVRNRFSAARPRSVVWIPRLVGVTAALAASIAIAEGLPSLLFSSIPSTANASNRPPVETLVVPRLGFASVVPASPTVPPRETPNKSEAAKQTADVAKALKDAAAKETKSVASLVPARKASVDQIQPIKKPAAKRPNDASAQAKPATETADRAAALPASNVATPPAPVQELTPPAPAAKEGAIIAEAPKPEAAPLLPAPPVPVAQAPAAQVLAVLPPPAKQRVEADRAKAEELELARGREAVLAKVAADRALAAEEAERRAWAARQSANREVMRALANSLQGLHR